MKPVCGYEIELSFPRSLVDHSIHDLISGGLYFSHRVFTAL